LSEVLRIIKSRWTEVLLIVVLQAGLMYIFFQGFLGGSQNSEEILKSFESMPDTKLFGMTFGMTTLGVICYMLYLGFLATAYIDKDQPQQPAKLITVGRIFFWRMLRLQILLGLAAWLISGIIGSFKGMANIAQSVGLMILIKPLVLCPAIMIVKNCGVFDSLALLKNYLLMKSDWLIKLIVAGLGAGFLLSFILANLSIEGTGKAIIDAASNIVSGLIGLAISLGGVIYIASLQPPVEKTETPETEGQNYE
jgi:hypothetical protein